ncbi:MAG: histidine phosphatase family protein [Acidimicrobiales bacterium]
MANATQLIVIRSGAGTQVSGVGGVRSDLFAGHRGCSGLSPGGVKQMVWLGGELRRRGIRPDVIYSSRLRRARQSATILGTLIGRPVAPPSCLWCARHPGSLDGAAGMVSLGRRDGPRAFVDR